MQAELIKSIFEINMFKIYVLHKHSKDIEL